MTLYIYIYIMLQTPLPGNAIYYIVGKSIAPVLGLMYGFLCAVSVSARVTSGSL